MKHVCMSLALALAVAAPCRAADAPKRSPKEALKALNDLVGPWKATGTPDGTAEEKQKGFWREVIHWDWQFKDDDVWLRATFEDGKHFAKGELRYLPDKDAYQMTLRTPAKESLTFAGTLKERRLVLEREDEKKKESQRLTVSLLHDNAFLYTYEVKPADRGLFKRLYRVSAIKDGVAFASGDGKPECIVSGGLGTIPVSHNGKTYYVCCSGCRDEFREKPDKYVKEYEEKKAKEKGK